MCYELNQKNISKKIRIFGKEFVNNNIHKCKIIYYDKENNKEEESDLKEYFNEVNPDYNNKDSIIFKLKGVNNITDMSHIFDECNMILKLPDISEIKTSKITNMSYMYNNCESLEELPDI